MLVCKQCGSTNNVGPRTLLCKECWNKQKSEKNKKRYYSTKERVRTRYKCICLACKNEFLALRESSLLCSNCNIKLIEFNRQFKATGNYEKDYNRDRHRTLAEEILKRRLLYNEVIHHLD
jgi:hypothetical protein